MIQKHKWRARYYNGRGIRARESNVLLADIFKRNFRINFVPIGFKAVHTVPITVEDVRRWKKQLEDAGLGERKFNGYIGSAYWMDPNFYFTSLAESLAEHWKNNLFKGIII